MKDLLTSLAAKVASWVILAVGTIFGAAVGIGALKEDYAQVKSRLSLVEAIQEKNSEKLNDIHRNVEYLRGRFDSNFKPGSK